MRLSDTIESFIKAMIQEDQPEIELRTVHLNELDNEATPVPGQTTPKTSPSPSPTPPPAEATPPPAQTPQPFKPKILPSIIPRLTVLK